MTDPASLGAILASHHERAPACPVYSLGHWFRLQREALNMSPGQLAAHAGFSNPADAGSRIASLESRGKATDDLIIRVGRALGLTPEILEERLDSARKDQFDAWTRWADEPVAPTASVRMMPAVWVTLELPPEHGSREAAVAWLASLPDFKGLVRCLSWDRRTAIYVDPDDSIRIEVSSGPGKNVHPSSWIA
jgi:hypothetical protein